MNVRKLGFDIALLLYLGVMLNLSYAIAIAYGYFDFTELIHPFASLQLFVLFIVFFYGKIHYRLITDLIDKRRGVIHYLLLYHLLLLFCFLLTEVGGNLLAKYLTDKDIYIDRINWSNGISFLVYFYSYVNALLGVFYLPSIVKKYKQRQAANILEINKVEISNVESQSFTSLVSQVLGKIKEEAHQQTREQQLQYLSDFMRFVVYESEEQFIHISKAMGVLKTLVAILNYTFPQVQLSKDGEELLKSKRLEMPKFIKALILLTQKVEVKESEKLLVLEIPEVLEESYS